MRLAGSSPYGSARRVPRARSRAGERCRRGGYVLAPSHRSMLDIPFVARRSRTGRIRFMGKAALFRDPGARLVLPHARRLPGGARRHRSQGAARLDRDAAERRAARRVSRRARASTAPKIEPLQPGAAYLALRAGVPIVPVGIAGSEEIVRSDGRRRFPRFEPRGDRGRRADRRRRRGRRARVPRARGRRAHRGTARGAPAALRRGAANSRERTRRASRLERSARHRRTRRAARSSPNGPPATRVPSGRRRTRTPRPRRARASARAARAAGGSTRPRR